MKTFIMKSERFLKGPLKESLSTRRPYLQHFQAAISGLSRPSYMNGGIQKSQKLLLNFKSATKSEINCPINVVPYAQKA